MATKMHTKILGLLAAMLLLSGCLTTRWEKPGAGQSDFEQIKAICMMEGHDRVPPQERTVLVSNGHYQERDLCRGNGCSTVGSYSPPRYVTVDANEELRNQVVKACFYRNGWQEVTRDEPVF